MVAWAPCSWCWPRSACLVAAYLTVGRWLARSVFRLDDGRRTPAHDLSDGRDYVPTRRAVVFGHHFTSIAGTGPIVGPAIAVMWGWLPGLLWVVFGSIFVGAVHDFGSLVLSLRRRGRTIGDAAGDLLGPRVRLLFLSILILGLWIVLAVFGLVIAAVLRAYPASIFPVLVQIPLAALIGVTIHRAGAPILPWSIAALALMYASVVFGDVGPLHAFNEALAAQPMWVWTAGLLVYAYAASVLPVWALLQPRDYINALQLITTLALLGAGLVGAALFGGAPLGAGAERPALEIVAPVIDWQPAGAPPLLPILFVTIACGACSGFHCLVASGTTSKQLTRESDARAVGYGSMLTEALLATLVIAACAAGIGLGIQWSPPPYAFVTPAPGFDPAPVVGAAAFEQQYASWGSANSLGAKVGAFVEGGSNLVAAIGVPRGVAVALIAVMVAAFAATTMDTACRLQRYVVQELSRTFLPREPGRTASPANPFRWLATRHGATAFAVVSAFLLAMTPRELNPFATAPELGPLASVADWLRETIVDGGSGGLLLWPLFGATNQLLAGFAFVAIGAWLVSTGRPWRFLIPPGALMLLVPGAALTWQAFIGNEANRSWLERGEWLLVGVGGLTLALEAWLLVEVWLRWRGRGGASGGGEGGGVVEP